MSHIISILNVILLIALPAFSSAEENTGVYRNSEYQFWFSYPEEWKTDQPQQPETVIKISSPDGKLSFNVGVARDSGLKMVQPEDFVKRFSKKTITQMYEKEFRDFKLLDSRETTLCAQPAYYFVYTTTSSDAARKLATWKYITYVTNRSELQYTLTAAGPEENFDTNRTLLMSIINSFTTGASLSQ